MQPFLSKQPEIMLDLETLGTQPDSVILTIGACAFNEDGIQGSFDAPIRLESCLMVGFTVEAPTLEWWMRQSKEARDRAFQSGTPFGILEALMSFSDWLGSYEADNVWGNGAAMDNVMLQHAYRRFRFSPPWSYRGDRCYRTVKSLFPDVPLPPMNETLAHIAVHDAEYQALHLIAINQSLKA